MMLVSNTLRADDVISQFRILGGELSNSAATSVSDIDEVLPRIKALGLNMVLVPVYWEFLEPVEGQMDFTLVDRIIDVNTNKARLTFWVQVPQQFALAAARANSIYNSMGTTNLNVILRPILYTPRRPVTTFSSAYFKRLRWF